MDDPPGWSVCCAREHHRFLAHLLAFARLGGRLMVDRAERVIRLDARYVTAVERMFQKWGPGLVFFGRLLPGGRILINILAGLARMSYLRFFAFTFLDTYIWCISWIGLGFFVGHEWTLVDGFIRQSSPWLLGGAFVLGVMIWMAGKLIHQRLRLILFLKEVDGGE